jgi:hypothetical protein
MFFYETYLDQEHGFLDLRDEERLAFACLLVTDINTQKMLLLCIHGYFFNRFKALK